MSLLISMYKVLMLNLGTGQGAVLLTVNLSVIKITWQKNSQLQFRSFLFITEGKVGILSDISPHDFCLPQFYRLVVVWNVCKFAPHSRDGSYR